MKNKNVNFFLKLFMFEINSSYSGALWFVI